MKGRENVEVLTILISILLLIVVVFSLLMYMSFSKQIKYYKMVSSSVASMSVIQKMFEIMGETIEGVKKIEKLNSNIIEIFSPKYSTICIFDGKNHEIKATNVEEEYKDVIVNIADENDFKTNALKNVSKYLSTSPDKTLTYKSAMERKIKSTMFSPIYYNETYLGFWLLEDIVENSFDNISKDELAKMKNNLGVFLENVQFQTSIELAQNTDIQTGYYTNMYLYSNMRRILASSDTSAFVIINLRNIPEINDTFGRNLGNMLIVKTANTIKQTVSSDTVLIRYSGIKFLIVFPDSTSEKAQPLVERIMGKIRDEYEYVEDKKVSIEPQSTIHNISRQNNIDKEIQKMIDYMDNMDESGTIRII